MSELVLVERRDDGVAVVTLNNPKVNALSRALLTELERVALGLQADPPGAVVVTGGDRLFAAGAEISEFWGGEAVIPRDEVLALGRWLLPGPQRRGRHPPDHDRRHQRVRPRWRVRAGPRLRPADRR